MKILYASAQNTKRPSKDIAKMIAKLSVSIVSYQAITKTMRSLPSPRQLSKNAKDSP